MQKIAKNGHAKRMPTSEQLLPPKITNCGRSAYNFLVSNLFLVALVTFPAHYDLSHAHTEYCTHRQGACYVRNGARNFVQS